MLRLVTSDSLPENSTLRVTHRVDTPNFFCEFCRCGIRQTIGVLRTRKTHDGRQEQPNVVLTHLKLSVGGSGRQVLQQYYEVSTRAKYVLVPPGDTVSSGSAKSLKTKRSSSRGRITRIKPAEISIRPHAQTFLDMIQVNSLVNTYHYSNQQTFTMEFWFATLTLFGMVIIFLGIVAFVYASENRSTGASFTCVY